MLPFKLACNFYAIMNAIQKGWLFKDWFDTYITEIPSMITTDFFTKRSRLNYIHSIKIRFCMQKTYNKQTNSINDTNLNTVIENIAILGNNKPKSNTIRQRKRKKIKEQRRRLNLAKKHEKMSKATFN